MQAIQEKKYLQFLFDLVFICKYRQEMKKMCIWIFAFLVHIHTASKGYQSTFLTFKQSFHIPTNFKKVCDILYFHTFWSNFHLMLKKDFWSPLSLQCPKAVCRINAINACIVYICTPVFQFSNCRIFCFFYRLFTVGLQEFAKKIMVDHSNLLIAGPLSWRPGNYIYLFTTIFLTH